MSEWIAAEFGQIFDDAGAVALLRLIAVNIANEHPQAVIEGLVRLHNDVGNFVQRLDSDEFVEWQVTKTIKRDEVGDPES